MTLIEKLDHARRHQRPLVMGIVNVTPDSFSDGGRYAHRDAAVAHALMLIEQGADMLDIGGESTRPGAAPVAVDDEIARVVPVIEMLAGRADLPISIDTSKPEVMRAAAAAGASMINDVNALRAAGAVETAAALDVAVCLMHMKGEPRTMQTNPQYDDVVSDVRDFLAARIEVCLAAGIERHKLVIDPGFGFGKTLAHNLVLLARLADFRSLEVPVLAGLSRKSMLGTLTGRPQPDQRQAASLAAAMLAADQGAAILRVHDVAETVDALCVRAAVADAGRGYNNAL